MSREAPGGTGLQRRKNGLRRRAQCGHGCGYVGCDYTEGDYCEHAGHALARRRRQRVPEPAWPRAGGPRANALGVRASEHLASRQRVVESMLHVGAETKHAGYDGYKSGLAARWRKDTALRSETALTGGYTLRERSAGRIDLQLPYIQPWNDTDFTSPPIVLSVIQV